METKHKALIVGAGIAGLSAAWWLDKAGWASVIVEKAPKIRDGGYIMSLSGLGLQSLQRMKVVENLEGISYRFHENLMHDRKGRELIRIRYADVHGGVESLAVCRDDLAHTLGKALPESATILFDETIAEVIDDGNRIHATLKSGEKIEADLLIGADGIRSSIRDQFWKDTDCLEQLGYSFAAYDVEAKEELKSDCVSFNRPGYLDVLYSLRNNRVAGLHIWRSEQTEVQHRQHRFGILRDVTVASVPLVSDVVEQAEKAGSSPLIDSLTMVALPQWSQGRVVLLGDLAHCLTLISGQGACMAVASAEILGMELMATKDIEQALANHEKKLRPAIERLQDRSRKMASMYIPKSAFMYYIRNLVLKIMPYSWIVSWHVKSTRMEAELTQT